MHSLTTLLRHVLDTETVIYECRDCGKTLEEDQTACPECGAESIAEYSFLG